MGHCAHLTLQPFVDLSLMVGTVWIGESNECLSLDFSQTIKNVNKVSSLPVCGSMPVWARQTVCVLVHMWTYLCGCGKSGHWWAHIWHFLTLVPAWLYPTLLYPNSPALKWYCTISHKLILHLPPCSEIIVFYLLPGLPAVLLVCWYCYWILWDHRANLRCQTRRTDGSTGER